MVKKKFNLESLVPSKGMSAAPAEIAEQPVTVVANAAPEEPAAQTVATTVPQQQAYKMMNIRLTKENAEFLRKEGAVRGMNVTSFVNWLVQEYRSDPSHVHDHSLMDSQDQW